MKYKIYLVKFLDYLTNTEFIKDSGKIRSIIVNHSSSNDNYTEVISIFFNNDNNDINIDIGFQIALRIILRKMFL